MEIRNLKSLFLFLILLAFATEAFAQTEEFQILHCYQRMKRDNVGTADDWIPWHKLQSESEYKGKILTLSHTYFSLTKDTKKGYSTNYLIKDLEVVDAPESNAILKEFNLTGLGQYTKEYYKGFDPDGTAAYLVVTYKTHGTEDIYICKGKTVIYLQTKKLSGQDSGSYASSVISGRDISLKEAVSNPFGCVAYSKLIGQNKKQIAGILENAVGSVPYGLPGSKTFLYRGKNFKIGGQPVLQASVTLYDQKKEKLSWSYKFNFTDDKKCNEYFDRLKSQIKQLGYQEGSGSSRYFIIFESKTSSGEKKTILLQTSQRGQRHRLVEMQIEIS